MLQTIKISMGHADESRIRPDDPTIGLRKLRTGSSCYRTWTAAEIETFYEKHPTGSRARLALDLMLHIGQRRDGIVRMGRQHVRDGILILRQSTTGTEVEIPLHPALRSSLDALPNKNMTFLLTEYGKPGCPRGFLPTGFVRLPAAAWRKPDAPGRRSWLSRATRI